MYRYWRLALELEMKERSWIEQASTLMGVRYRSNKKKNSWETIVEGYRAFEIVKAIRPYLYGLKAVAADIILGTGPTLPISDPRPQLPSLKGKKSVDRGGGSPTSS